MIFMTKSYIIQSKFRGKEHFHEKSEKTKKVQIEYPEKTWFWGKLPLFPGKKDIFLLN